jgi:hypothetical protein
VSRFVRIIELGQVVSQDTYALRAFFMGFHLAGLPTHERSILDGIAVLL